MLSASESATFNEPSKKINSYAKSLSSFFTDYKLLSNITYNNPVLMSMSSLLLGNSLVILSKEFFYETNSSILITIPVSDLIDY